MHGYADCRQCGKYNTELKIGALLCRPKRETSNYLRRDEYIQFSTGHRVGVCIGGSGVCVGGEGGMKSRWEVLVLPVIFITPG